MAAPKTIRLFEEISVLNEIIRDNCTIHKLVECIDPYSVSITRHRILRRVFAELYGLQHPIDLVTLGEYLSDRGLLESVGGFTYLHYIAEFHNSKQLNSCQDLHPSRKIDTASQS